ncbi:MAG: hypothetical protein FJ264_12135 [Planctomycetes bacterium]|nr:hypothetical protein [Planctomycetota bacterium]
MKLPNLDLVQVEKKKIIEYLLSTSHPDGSSKASFFAQFGFSAQNWETLAQSFRKHVKMHDIAKVVESDYGTRYSVDGYIETPDGRNPNVRSVWIIPKQSRIPRLITAHPIKR